MGQCGDPRQYRKLVMENHPDKLIARGVPKEFVAIATEGRCHQCGLWTDREGTGDLAFLWSIFGPARPMWNPRLFRADDLTQARNVTCWTGCGASGRN